MDFWDIDASILISMHFYQRNMEAMYTETEYLLKEVLNEELHRKQLELNMFYVSRIVVDTVPDRKSVV